MQHSFTRIAGNTVFVFLARSLELVAGVLTVSIPARYLGVSGFGEYSFIWALSLTLTPVMAFGCERILIRDMAVNGERAPALLVTGLILNVVMSFLALILAVAVVLIFGLGAGSVLPATCMAVLSQVLNVLTRTVVTVFMARERMVYDLVITGTSRLLTIGLIVAVTFTGLGTMGLFAASASANAVGLAMAFTILFRRFLSPGQMVRMDSLKYVFRESLPVAITTFIGQGYRNINVFLLKFYHDLTQVSFFQAPLRFITPFSLFPTSFLLSFVPGLSRMADEDSTYSQLRYAYRKMLKYFVLVNLPVCALVTLHADGIVHLLFGEEFSDAAGSFRILIWVLIPFFLNTLLNVMLTSIRRQKVMAASNTVALALNIVFALLLIPKYGHTGASVSFLLSAFGLLTVNLFLVGKYIGIIPLTTLWKPLLSCSIASLVSHLLTGKIGVFASTPLFVLAYGFILYALDTFTSDEMDLLKGAFAGRRPGQGKWTFGAERSDKQ